MVVTPLSQVEAVSPASISSPKAARGAALKSIKNPVHQYNNIEVRHNMFSQYLCHMQVGHKMNSYTISELLPSSHYNVMLCLKKNKHIIPVGCHSSGIINLVSR